MGRFDRHLMARVATIALALTVAAGSVQAQVGSPLRVMQRSSISAEQLSQIFDNSTPMEMIASDNPLDRAASIAPQRTAQTLGEPEMTWAQAGRAQRVGRGLSRLLGENNNDRAGRQRAAAPAPSPWLGLGTNSGIEAQNYGRGNEDTIYHYNDYMQQPAPIYYEPYRQTGRYLFQAADGQWYNCTAALINQAILLTAGHCVHDGSGTAAGWNQDGYFYPAFSNRFSNSGQRFGSCRTSYYVTTTGWFNNGALNRGNDVAMALCSRLTGGSWNYARNRLPGEALGYYGFCYRNCVSGYDFLTQLGYPANYHRGRQMTVSQHLSETALTGGPDYLYGTGMRGGSSGGPHIQNIGNLWDHSSNRGQNNRRNTIMAVTSWGYTNESIKLQAASPISGVNNNNNAAEMYNMVCRQSRSVHGSSSCQLL